MAEEDERLGRTLLRPPPLPRQPSACEQAHPPRVPHILLLIIMQ